MRISFLFAPALLWCAPAWAGPPFATDDAEPTGTGEYEVYLFASGARATTGSNGATGIDFNYGAGPDLQLTFAIPLEWEKPLGGPAVSGIGNIELAAKYRFAHQSNFGVDIAVFPRLFLPAVAKQVGDQHASLLLPLWVEHDWKMGSLYGGGGCTFALAKGAKDFCTFGIVASARVAKRLQIGAELVHETPATAGGAASTKLGFGATWDLNDHVHLLVSAGPGLQHCRINDRANWYVSL
ncbi:MAG: hypothetical protein RL367_2845, partial [Pseudomonadota bacterium]